MGVRVVMDSPPMSGACEVGRMLRIAENPLVALLLLLNERAHIEPLSSVAIDPFDRRRRSPHAGFVVL